MNQIKVANLARPSFQGQHSYRIRHMEISYGSE
jgi:hypothetical protein